MNKGIQNASGDYINFMNAGDMFYNKNILNNLFHGVSFNNADIVYGDSIVVSMQGNELGYLKALEFNTKNLIQRGTRTVCHQSIFVKRDKAPFYNLRYRYKGELDWYFEIIKINKELKILYKNIPVVYYSLGGIGHVHFYTNLCERIQLVFERFGFIKSLFNILNYIIAIVFHYISIIRSKMSN